MPVSWAEMRRRSAGGKENESPKKAIADLLYPAKPARSVYNSPLIKTNRSPLWKSPIPSADLSLSPLSFSTSSSADNLKAKSQQLQKSLADFSFNASLSTTPTAPSLSNLSSPQKKVLLSKDQRLYPSLPRTDHNEIHKSPIEEKNLKEQSNRLTANAQRKSSQNSYIQSVRNKFENLMNAPATSLKEDNTSDGYSCSKNSEDSEDIEVCLTFLSPVTL